MDDFTRPRLGILSGGAFIRLSEPWSRKKAFNASHKHRECGGLIRVDTIWRWTPQLGSGAYCFL